MGGEAPVLEQAAGRLLPAVAVGKPSLCSHIPFSCAGMSSSRAAPCPQGLQQVRPAQLPNAGHVRQPSEGFTKNTRVSSVCAAQSRKDTFVLNVDTEHFPLSSKTGLRHATGIFTLPD